MTGNPFVLVTYIVSEDGEQLHPMDTSVLRIDLDTAGEPTAGSVARVASRVTEEARRKVARRHPVA